MALSFCGQVDPMFTVPAPPAPGHPGAPGSSLPSAPSFSPPALPTSNPKQLVVRTRSIGTNTQDGGISGALEGDSACLGPCQPGTSVNLEGIVWHETEEGKFLNIQPIQMGVTGIYSLFLEPMKQLQDEDFLIFFFLQGQN